MRHLHVANLRKSLPRAASATQSGRCRDRDATWAASKAFLSGTAVRVVAALLALVVCPLALWVLSIVFVTGPAFAGLGLIMRSLSPSYDFFMYYFILAITPMMLASGVFFPLDQLPSWLQAAAFVLPLTHAVALVRPLMTGGVPQSISARVVVMVVYAVASRYIALVPARRRLLK
jgi:lipooligosaccharide transport system permease protein